MATLSSWKDSKIALRLDERSPPPKKKNSLMDDGDEGEGVRGERWPGFKAP